MATRETQGSRSGGSRSGGSRSGGSRIDTSRGRSRSRSEGGSAFSWGDNAGPLIGATLIGAAIGIAANFGRKFATQAMSGMAGDWDEVLAAEHDMALAIFDKILATDETQTFKRTMLIKQLTHALDKHAHQEEMVVYPALREAGQRVEADELNGEHGYVKDYLFQLNELATDSPEWIEKVREFRAFIAQHAKMEEERVFPELKSAVGPEANDRITSLMNRDGFWQA